MEFLFLIQGVYVEILILILLFVVLVVILGKNFYAWLKHIYMLLGGSKYIRKTLSPTSDIHSVSEIVPEEKPVEKIQAKENIEEHIEVVTEKIDTSQVEKLTNLVSSIRTLIARGMNVEAQALIIEGLSIDKDHRDLNLLLGTIYEQDGHYEKAEYIYKDLAEIYVNDIEILERLANVLIVEKKYTIASEIYKKIHKATGNTETTLYMLTHISNTLEDHKATLKYAKQYVLQWPKNPDIITVLANTQVMLGLRKEAIETYKNLKNLTPYSNEISEILQKLLIEEELANNFETKEA